MGLLDGLQPPNKLPSCRVRTILEKLDAKDAAIFDTAIKSPEIWPSRTLSKELAKRNIIISDNVISFHRKNGCSCGRIK
jgi:hypothetical protein